jgi:hypothetical protein
MAYPFVPLHALVELPLPLGSNSHSIASSIDGRRREEDSFSTIRLFPSNAPFWMRNEFVSVTRLNVSLVVSYLLSMSTRLPFVSLQSSYFVRQREKESRRFIMTYQNMIERSNASPC